MKRALVLCEGYYDRAFWSGWLEYLGCRPPQPRERRTPPDGSKPDGGQFWFRDRADDIVWLIPCGGKDQVPPTLERRVRERATSRFERLVVCIDADVPALALNTATGLRAEDVRRMVKGLEPNGADGPNGDVVLPDGAVVSLVRWEAADGDFPGLPIQQCLERLVCAALVAAYPERAPVVQAWLDGRPSPPARNPKEHAWSYMAGWYADHGCEDFFREVWRDERIVSQMESRLEASGAWRVGAALVG